MSFKIEKRDGKIIDFNPEKITTAIFKAAQSVGGEDYEMAKQLSGLVQDYLYIMEKEVVHVEEIQDLIEKVLIEEGHAKTAKSFILYRQKRKELREAKSFAGIVDDWKISLNALKILQGRYLQRDENGTIFESPKELLGRVCKHIAQAEKTFGGDESAVAAAQEKFFQLLCSLRFLPNSPLLMNAGTKEKLLSAIVALPIEDSVRSIYKTLSDAALYHQRGAGTGFSFSSLRPRGDIVNNTFGVANGPLEFLKVYDKALSKIKQRGRRPGANMAILRIDHPDILDFITCKERRDIITNFNLSVGITSTFMEAVKKNENYNVVNPRSGEVIGQLNAKRTFDLIATMAWKNGDPGIVFLDRLNNERSNPTPGIGKVETTSPCGEQALLPYESVVLGSINLSLHTIKDSEKKKYVIDWNKLKNTVHAAVHFLDNATEMNEFPLEESKKLVKGNRKIGLGVMGFADLLIKMRVAYNSSEALQLADAIMRFVNEEAQAASRSLAVGRGVFPNIYNSLYESAESFQQMRNASRTTISPTGTISLLAGCSQSIEPLYALSYLRKTPQFEMLEVNPLFEEIAKEEGFYNEALLRKISRRGSIQNMEEIPLEIRKIFVTAMDLSPEDHVRVQAAFQKHVDNAVSKTVNFPYYATVEDVAEVFMLAYELGCKGITIYRDGSHDGQVLTSSFTSQHMNMKQVEAKKQAEKERAGSKEAVGADAAHPHIERNSHLYD